jgi:hypothetical protein
MLSHAEQKTQYCQPSRQDSVELVRSLYRYACSSYRPLRFRLTTADLLRTLTDQTGAAVPNATVTIANLGTNDGMSIERAPAEYKAKAQGLLGEKFTIIMDDMQRTMAITGAVKDAAAV